MSKKEIANDINLILAEKDIDERIKPFLKLYFLAKLKTEELSLEEIITQIDLLVSRILNVEFISGDKLIVAYESKQNVLTINKDKILAGKTDEIILPVFMKFEEALNIDNRNGDRNHLEDFIRAGRKAKAISVPISDKLYKLYEMAESCYGSIEDKVDELSQDSSWTVTCGKYNQAINNMVITGQDDRDALLNGVSLFHYETYTGEALDDLDFSGPFKSEEYQIKAAKIFACIENIKKKEYKNKYNFSRFEYDNLASFKKNIKIFTGCSDEAIEFAKSKVYHGDEQISQVIEDIQRTKVPILTEEYIVRRVQEVIDRKTKWDSRIKHLVIPFFIRSQKIYNWTMDEFNERLNNIALQIDEIVFEDLESLDEMGGTAVNKINLNSSIFFDSKR